jgi:transcriptional regulator with XRE-family HTH domain
MSSSISHPRLAGYLVGVARYLASFRAREGLTQSEMAGRLGLSLNRYRDFEQNTTDNSKGIALDLLLRIADLESLELPQFLARLGDSESAVTSESHLDPWQEKLLAHFSEVSIDEREQFLQVLENPVNPDERARQVASRRTDETREPLMPRRVRWWVRLGVLMCQLPYDTRLRFERQILEDYIEQRKPQPDDPHSQQVIERLRELLKHYFTHFELLRR